MTINSLCTQIIIRVFAIVMIGKEGQVALNCEALMVQFGEVVVAKELFTIMRGALFVVLKLS